MNTIRFQKYPEPIKMLSVFLIKKINQLRTFFYNRRQEPQFVKYNQSRPLGPQKQVCYAPMRSLYFGMDGKVTPCCLNRSFVYGDMKQLEVKQIWKSEQMNEFRQILKNNDLSHGCFHCKNRLEGGNFDAMESILFDIVPQKRFPSMLEFELSNECNLDCLMCTSEYSSCISKKIYGRNVQNSNYGDDFLHQLDEFIPHLVKTKFMGGEPFLVPLYAKIWNKIIEINPSCVIVIQTNATILNEKIKSLLHNGNLRISISIDSFQKETYETIRRNANFEEVMNHVAYFANHALRHKYVFNISVCPMQQNWRELPEIIQKANQLNACVYFNTVWTPENCSLNALNPQELGEIIESLSLYELPVHSQMEKKNLYHFQCFINQLKAWKQAKEEALKQKKENNLLWEKHREEIEQKSIEELCSIIIQKLEEEVSEGFISDEKLGLYLSKLIQVSAKFENAIKIKRALFNLMQMPGEIIIQELESYDTEHLYRKASEMVEEISEEDSL